MHALSVTIVQSSANNEVAFWCEDKRAESAFGQWVGIIDRDGCGLLRIVYDYEIMPLLDVNTLEIGTLILPVGYHSGLIADRIAFNPIERQWRNGWKEAENSVAQLHDGHLETIVIDGKQMDIVSGLLVTDEPVIVVGAENSDSWVPFLKDWRAKRVAFHSVNEITIATLQPCILTTEDDCVIRRNAKDEGYDALRRHLFYLIEKLLSIKHLYGIAIVMVAGNNHFSAVKLKCRSYSTFGIKTAKAFEGM